MKDSNRNKSPSNTREPFEQLKIKLDGDFLHFIQRHRFSSIMTGSKFSEGKSGDYYLKNKKWPSQETSSPIAEFNPDKSEEKNHNKPKEENNIDYLKFYKNYENYNYK